MKLSFEQIEILSPDLTWDKGVENLGRHVKSGDNISICSKDSFMVLEEDSLAIN
jgi:hypothetical protein